MKEILQTKLTMKSKYQKVVLTKLAFDAPKLSSLMLSLILENGWHAFLPLKVFRTESRGKIPIRGEGCNTLGVSHQLSNGFELQHGKFSSNQEL